MKKGILFFTLTIIFLFSCKKEHKSSPQGDVKKYKVSFNVQGFTSTVTGSTSKLQTNTLKTAADEPLSSNADIFYYNVYKTNTRTLVNFISQLKTDPDFGKISDSLPAGTYDIFMAAGKTGFYSIGGNLNYGTGNWQDTFSDKFTLTVAGSDVSQNVTLSRMDAQLEIDFSDIIPLNAQTIDVVLDKEYIEYDPFLDSPTKPGTVKITTVVPASAKGAANFQIRDIVLNTLDNFGVTVNCYDSAHNRIAYRFISGVHCQKNTRTVISGAIFGSNTNLTVTGEDWDPTPITVHF